MTRSESETLEFKTSFGEWKECIHPHQGVVLDGAPRRKEVWGVPLPAVREALINAVVHRDDADPGNVQVLIFSDRLEIWSPGLLATGIPLEQLGMQDRSQPRNRNLAHLFRRAGVIESFGTGFQRMAAACREVGNPAPRYFEASGAFVVCFPFSAKTSQEVGEKRTVNQAKILELLAAEPSLSAKALSQRLGISSRKTEENLALLKAKGGLRRIGSDRGGYWAVGETM